MAAKSTKYTKHFSTKKTSQREPIPGKNQAKNNAGGYVFEITPEQQFKRFLILGTENGSYYESEHKMTVGNAKKAIDFIKSDGKKAVKLISDISVAGRAPKNDAAVFALALVCSFGDVETKKAAYHEIVNVCRIGTDLFAFCQSIQDLRGWSRGLRNGVGDFYSSRDEDQLAYQLIKYRQRNGWTHRDVLRLCHEPHAGKAKAMGQAVRESIFRFALGTELAKKAKQHAKIKAFESLQALLPQEMDVKKNLSKKIIEQACALIHEHDMPREALPTEFLNSPDIWEALLEKMPMTALIRNLGKMTSIGLLKNNMGKHSKQVVEKLADVTVIRKARVHPIKILLAMKTYQQGHGERGSLSWNPVQSIVAALDEAFYIAFENIEPTNQRIFIGLDVSGSMSGTGVGGIGNLSAREASSAIAMAAIRREPNYEIFGFADVFMPLKINKRMSLVDICKYTDRLPMMGTDCALPMVYALQNKIEVDCFQVYTDNETWAGDIQPAQALKKYRDKMGIPAKLAVCGVTSTGFSIADPEDSGQIDLVGFDAGLPVVLSEFMKGW